jgi:hypothetical protein
MPDPMIRPATAADIAAFYGAPPMLSLRAMVAVDDGTPVAVAGLAYQGAGKPPYLFSDIAPAMRRHAKTILRGARAMLAQLARPGMAALADPEHPGAARLLMRLGFVPAGCSDEGEVFVYRGGGTSGRTRESLRSCLPGVNRGMHASFVAAG